MTSRSTRRNFRQGKRLKGEKGKQRADPLNASVLNRGGHVTVVKNQGEYRIPKDQS
ncbi:hypothetical protein SLEP1_g4375 [Rubroshorea leprosula]|uniref:Uncharacterized protein n=1 Tax=Rubroshorea leprosula TaxID=152421 RepID=A0AAV5HUA8_9ROSI|nr:hypothetical protein SLEP1_g4375 [Rubroshorea leprosula]